MRRTRMARSMTDRVLGGVCGGLSLYLGINPWWARGLIALLTVLSGGVAALLYLVLWLALPPDMTPDVPYTGRDLLALLLVGLAILLTGGIVAARGLGLLSGPTGTDLFWPAVLVIMGVAVLIGTLRRA